MLNLTPSDETFRKPATNVEQSTSISRRKAQSHTLRARVLMSHTAAPTAAIRAATPINREAARDPSGQGRIRPVLCNN